MDFADRSALRSIRPASSLPYCKSSLHPIICHLCRELAYCNAYGLYVLAGVYRTLVLLNPGIVGDLFRREQHGYALALMGMMLYFK